MKRKALKLYLVFCTLICIAVIMLPWWPAVDSILVVKYLLLFAPRWWLLLLVLLNSFFWRSLTKPQWVIFISLVLLSFKFLDFQLPRSFFNEKKGEELKLITANIGGGGTKEVVQLLVSLEEPDVLLLQEAGRIELSTVLNDSYQSECISGLCIASKLPFERLGTLDRKMFEGWGSFAALYQISTLKNSLVVANVHLETPRSVLMGLRYGVFDSVLASKVEKKRKLETDSINHWRKDLENVVIAGDFNMPEDDPLYQAKFNDLNNVLSMLATGFNYTKFTSWHGVRIDHILYSDKISLSNAKVIDTSSGDHRPVMATLLLGDN